MADFVFRLAPNIVLGSYTVSRLGQFAREWGSKFMVILDPILKEVETAQKITQSLADRKIDFFVFDTFSGTADSECVKAALSLAKKAHVQGVIAAGGSKALNLGRAVSTLYNETNEVYDYADGAVPSAEPLPLLCVPTAIRDMFLFTEYTPLIDARSSRFMVLKAPQGLCKLALFDPTLALTLRQNQRDALSIETLCLAVEAYISQKATFFSDMIVEKSVELLSYAIDGSPSLVVTTPAEVLLCQAGCMASLGAASSAFGAASLLSLCINARFNISRSLSTNILFPYLLEDAAMCKAERLAKLSRIVRAAPAEASTEEAAAAFTEYVRQHLAKANLPTRLKDLGVTIEQLSLAIEDAGGLDFMNSLARSMTSDDLFTFIKQAF